MQSSLSSEKKRVAHIPNTTNFDQIKVFTSSNVSNRKTTTGCQTKKHGKKSKRQKDDFINDADTDEDNNHHNDDNDDATPEINFYQEVLNGSVTNEGNILTKAEEKEIKLEFSRKYNEYTGRLREKPGKRVLNEKLIGDIQIRNAFEQQKQTTTSKSRSKRPVPVDSLDVEPIDNQKELPVSLLRDISGRNLDWDEYLDIKNKNISTRLRKIPPVSYFKNAPLANIWETIAKPGLLIELRNHNVKDIKAYWIAKIVYFAGYRALVRFVDFQDDEAPGYMEWISFCSGVPKPLGWVEKEGENSLIPGPIISGMSEKSLQSKLKELYASHKNSDTIEPNHKANIIKHIQKMQKLDSTVAVECLDLMNFAQTRLAKITTVLGNRCHVSYYGDDGVRNYPKGYKTGFCFSFHCETIHPFGWSQSVGVQLNGNPKNLQCSALPPEAFPTWQSDKIEIKVGMRLETRHPISTHRFVGAIITKVLKHGYFQIETRDEKPSFRSPFVHHITSPFIYPVGFGKENGLDVEYAEPPGNSERLRLRLDLLPPRPPHKFAVGMKLEAFCVRDTRFALAATIQKVAGHMLYIHFDKWDPSLCENFVWMDCEYSDLFPLGYSEMVAIDWQGVVDDC